MHRTILGLAATAALALPAAASAATATPPVSAATIANATVVVTANTDTTGATDTIAIGPSAPTGLAASTSTGGAYCPGSAAPYHGRAGSRWTLRSGGATGQDFDIAWIQVEQEYWCWVGNKIAGWGATTGTTYAWPGYCWTNRTLQDGWWSPWWERRAMYAGSVGISTILGCQGLRSANARLYYRAGGAWNIG